MDTRHEPILTKNFIVLLLASGLFSATLHLTLPLIPLYWDRSGLEEGTIGLLLALSPLATVLTMPTVGKLVDRLRCKPFLIIGLILFGLPFPFYLAADTIGSFGLLRLLQGIGLACYLPAVFATLSDVSPPRRRGEAMGLFGVIKALIFAFAPAQGLIMVETSGFSLPFYLAGVFTILGVAVSLILPEPKALPKDLGQAQGKRVRDVLAMAPVALAIFVMFTATTAFGTTNYLPLWAEDVGLRGSIGLFYTCTAFSQLVASFVGGKLSDKRGRLTIVTPSLLLVAVSLVLIGRAENLPVLIIAAILFGSGFGSAQAGMNAYVIDVTSPIYRGTAMGVYQSAFDLGLGFGQLTFGFMAIQLGYSSSYLLTALVPSLGFISLLLLAHHPKLTSPPTPGPTKPRGTLQ